MKAGLAATLIGGAAAGDSWSRSLSESPTTLTERTETGADTWSLLADKWLLLAFVLTVALTAVGLYTVLSGTWRRVKQLCKHSYKEAETQTPKDKGQVSVCKVSEVWHSSPTCGGQGVQPRRRCLNCPMQEKTD